MSRGRVSGCAVLLGLFWTLLLTASPVQAVTPPYELDPTLSLTGDCSVGTFDPVPDPGCPYPPPPNGPSGRFDDSRAVAIDPYGNEYVASYASPVDANGRIDVFDDEGNFVTEVAVPNPKSLAVDSKGNLYVFMGDEGEILRFAPSEYEPETGGIAYSDPPNTVTTGSFVGALAVDFATDRLLVVQGSVLTIYRSAAEAEPNSVFDVVGTVGRWVEAIAVDAERRRIYVTSCKGEFSECGVKVLEADDPYSVLKEIYGPPDSEFLSLFGRMGLAVDEGTGDFFVADIPEAKTIYRFDEDYGFIASLKNSEFQANVSIQIAVSNGERSAVAESCGYPDPADLEVPSGEACNRHYLFVPVLKSNGRVVAFHPPGQTPPVIEEVSTGDVSQEEAELRATIFPGGLETSYHFEITPQATYEAEGFNGANVIGQGDISAESLATEVSIFATGLLPGETYRFRVVASNALGGAEEEGQNEGTFATYSDASSSESCPNQAFRLGSSALLPDCRAYELVTPPNTNGRPPRGVGFVGNLFTTVHSSPVGDAVSFKIEGGSIPGTSGVGSFEGDPYLAQRGDSGWVTDLAGATGDEATVSIPGSSSPDQGYSFWSARIEGPLVVEGEESQYLRYPDGHSELIGRGSIGSDHKAEGRLITDGATHIVFETINIAPTLAVQLEPNAPPDGTETVYDRTIDPSTGIEETHVVSLLPGDVTPADGQDATYQGASKDGEGIAFSIGNKLYVRVGNESTYEVGENVKFAGVSEGGARVFYVQAGNLKAFDTATQQVIGFSITGNVTPVNISSGGARAYFVSPSKLGGSNPLGNVAQTSEQNLYLSEEGAISFIATVTDRDVEGEPAGFDDGLGLWTEVGAQIAKDPSRTNPDGSVLLFQSRAEITGYEESEFPQIYRYDSDKERLHCISCIPTGAPATGGASLESYTFDSLDPRPFSPNGFVPNLTPDGKRVFFESTEALVSTDTDEVQDVYEWEEEGVGSCTRPGGCVYLISSGQSSRDNFLYAHSTSGGDVFFTTGDALTGWDTGGAVSIYDARVGGGFPEPAKKEDCIGEGCQQDPVSPSPSLVTPTTKPVGRSGASKARRFCPKGKRKVKRGGKVRCVKKKHRKHKHRAGTSRGAAQ